MYCINVQRQCDKRFMKKAPVLFSGQGFNAEFLRAHFYNCWLWSSFSTKFLLCSANSSILTVWRGDNCIQTK